VSKLPLDDVVNGRTSNFIDSILIREADRAGVGVPMMRTKGSAESIEGGYVHSLEPGLYDWVAVLDFRAQYPSIIIEKNICFTTLSEEGATVSPIGVKFLSKEQREGLLPRILARLLRDRAEIRRRMEEDPDHRQYYDGLQGAVKVLMNAFYGVLASSFYRFTDPKIGASITAFGRENVKSVIAQLEAEGIKVLYADTDSCFWQSPTPALEPTVELGKRLAERFSRGSIQMEFEKVMRTFFTHGKKKRYAGNVVWPKVDFVVRGYEIRRTDAFGLQSEAQREVFELILGEKPEAAVERAKELVREVRRGNVPLAPAGTDPLEMLVISRTVKDEGAYVNPESMTNVQAFKKLKELGYEVVTGMKVSWIVTNGKKQPQEVEPYVSGRAVTVEPDWDYYARRLAQTLSYVTEVYGWDERGLLTGVLPPKQATLFADGFGEEPLTEEAPRRAKRKQSLEDFF
jgi:DNA polymerase I